MDKTEESGCLIAIVCLLLGGLIAGFVGFWVGCDTGRHTERNKAIEAGVGAWKIDARTGESKFEYGK